MIIRELKKILILNFTVFLAVFFSAVGAVDQVSPERELYWKRIEAAAQGCPVNTLFAEHHLPSNFGEFRRAKDACSKAYDLLEIGKGEEAVPYIVFAERFYIDKSLLYLARISFGMYCGIPSETRNQIKKKCARILTTQKDVTKLRNCYDRMTRRNIALLEKKHSRSNLNIIGDYLKNKVSSLTKKNSHSMKGISYKDVISGGEESQEELYLSSDSFYSEAMPMIPLEKKKSL